jgi:protein-tyrosine phosphatase
MIYWINNTPWQGRLGISSRPRGGDWLEDEILSWRDQGVDEVVSLLEPEEVEQLNLKDESRLVRRERLKFRSFPIPDRNIPQSRDSARSLISNLSDALQKGKRVLIHCRQGVGRSGMIAAAVLMDGGVEMHGAIGLVREARGVEVPETPEQFEWLAHYVPHHAVR